MTAAETPVGEAEQLDALGDALTAAGWRTMRYGDAPPMLRVTRPHVPDVGETVTVTCEPSGPWYRSSTGDLMAPCGDVAGAAGYVDRTLGRLIPARP